MLWEEDPMQTVSRIRVTSDSRMMTIMMMMTDTSPEAAGAASVHPDSSFHSKRPEKRSLTPLFIRQQNDLSFIPATRL